ncbi:MAG: hypothetical protein ABIV06_02560 [Thermoanaerobaculia bacterium]
MLSSTYRAACFVPRQTRMPIPLTGPELRNLGSRELIAEGMNSAAAVGCLDEDGSLEVLPVVGSETFEVSEVESLRWSSTVGTTTGGSGVLGKEDCRKMTEALAEGRARIVGSLHNDPGYSHTVELTHNLDDTLLPFSVVYHALLR